MISKEMMMQKKFFDILAGATTITVIMAIVSAVWALNAIRYI